ncbi:nitrogen regulation protein NR(I) [Acidithiobacillus caldus]|uniref:DNA-binding transcriptional regulator NtrC n=1 Tax=Acidithiobacillus caldus TaxID=33059 RepID=A0A1E7YPP1_9PROT|nr:nitrogen regulation protein NR(I) [Acidithiobacillus caldus]OFC30669.1 nitrogen regulation protein NR(I) [Acidithiobacillus caldus]OFC37373.1 nitrogen regulation protein NR(I) [Acidithiobacillus caldus]OFC41770.1 nitrogen regulation protein NR(I) [Acidithiobacillus caldus]
MKGCVWIVDDDPSIRWVLERALQKAELQTVSFADADAALQRNRTELPDVVLTDLRMPGTQGFAFLETLQKRHPELPVIVMTAHSDLENAVTAFAGGAFEYLAKPFDLADAVELVQRALRRRLGSMAESREADDAESDAEIIGQAPAMQAVYRAIGRLSRSEIPVLILGESGSGKELIARALHRHSPRASGPFIAINTAAIPAELLESELFGHERGAFTGAVQSRKGRFEQAAGGTLFLDEIGDMPAALQTRLLRVLSDGSYYRVGGQQVLQANVRLLAATHQDLESKVRDGSFREDLYHRLHVVRLQIPPLRERREDIPLLARYFLRRAATELGTEAKRLAPEAEVWMEAWHWPGNVRQLENVCRWLTVMAPAPQVEVADLPPELRHRPGDSVHDTSDGPMGRIDGWLKELREELERRLRRGDDEILDELGTQFERCCLETALHFTRGHKQRAAQKLGWGRNTITRKLRELGIDVEADDTL